MLSPFLPLLLTHVYIHRHDNNDGGSEQFQLMGIFRHFHNTAEALRPGGSICPIVTAKTLKR